MRSQRLLQPLMDEAARTFPALRRAAVAQAWAGGIDVTPDAIAVISAVPTIPGLFIGTGFSGHGFGIGPATGELLADFIMGARRRMDVGPFRSERFSDSSRIAPDDGFT